MKSLNIKHFLGFTLSFCLLCISCVVKKKYQEPLPLMYNHYYYNETDTLFQDTEYFTFCEELPYWGQNNRIDIFHYLDSCVNLQPTLQKVKANIVLKIEVNKKGNILCRQVSIKSNDSLDPLIFRNIVNQMSNWHPGKQRKQLVSCFAFIFFNLDKGKVIPKFSK